MQGSIALSIIVLALMLSTGYRTILNIPYAVEAQTESSSNGNLGNAAGQQEEQTPEYGLSYNHVDSIDSTFLIEFGPRKFVPPPLINATSIPVGNTTFGNVTTADRVHFLVQFNELPRAEEREELERTHGLNLLEYAGGNTYVASYVFPTNVTALNSDILTSNLTELEEEIRWVGPVEVAHKVSPILRPEVPDGATALEEDELIPEWAIADTPTEDRIVLTIQFHRDINISDGEDLVKTLGGNITGSAPDVPSVTAEFNIAQVDVIAEQDSVKFVDVVSPPLGPQNDGARNAASVAPLHSDPFGLTGQGITIMVYDSGNADTVHPDFGIRIIESDLIAAVTDHATHVAGTVGGSGNNSDGFDSAGNPNGGSSLQWKGMAPSINIRSFGLSGSPDVLYDTSGDLNQDITTAINSSIDMATMSLGNNVVRNGFPCTQLGDYTTTAILIDNIVKGIIDDELIIFFESAGNERKTPIFDPQRCQQMGGYFTISPPATAKNSIVVGAINSDDNSIAKFSSWGPTDDGRIKPDIVAPGCETTSRIKSTGFLDENQNHVLDQGEVHSAYVEMCGTSMATPVASGASALLLEGWYRLNGNDSRLLPGTMKAILIHSAKDIGQVGPDYQSGWGALDAKSAMDLIYANNASGPIIHEEQLDQGDTIVHRFNSNGSSNIKVTLAWNDDPSASRLATRALVNDLDLRLIDPNGVVYEPFVLDPSSPDNPASTGNDTINNVEMVIGNAEPGNWTVSITGRTVPFGPQIYTLIKPAADVT